MLELSYKEVQHKLVNVLINCLSDGVLRRATVILYRLREDKVFRIGCINFVWA